MKEYVVIPDTGQPSLLAPPSQHVQLNKHLCVACDVMVQRFAYAKYFHKYILPGTGQSGGARMQHTNDRRTTPVYQHLSDLRALAKSAEGGCHLCSLFVNQLHIQRQGLVDLETLPNSSKCLVGLLFNKTPQPGGALYDLVMLFEDFSVKQNVELHLHLRPVDGQIVPIIGYPKGLPFPILEDGATCSFEPTATGQEHSRQLDTINSWLEGCLTHHSLCSSVSSSARSSAILPARLIHVGSASNFSDLKLVEVSPGQPPPRWVTLSHCWGPPGSIPLTLSDSNLEQLKKKIPFRSLANNFKDAVGATRHLAERFGPLYLWIDALCIIQGSTQDWASEAPKMGHLYAGSLCTLFACRGTDSSAGLWESSLALSKHECYIQGGADSCLRGRWQIRDVDSFENSVQRSKLCSRAWVHQEVNLSTRRIYFAPGQLYWECCQCIRQEMDPGELPSSYSLGKTGALALMPINYDRELTHQQRTEKLYGTWLANVEQHSSLGITYASDKLPSLAATAQIMVELLKSPNDYIAGTWKSIFWACILWEIRSPTEVSKAENGSPSWSCTSVLGAVHFVIRPAYFSGTNRKLDALSPEATFDQFDAQPVLKDFPMGQLSEASVRVKGRVLKLKMHLTVDSRQEMPLFAQIHYAGQILATPLPMRLDHMEDWKATGDYDFFALVVAHDSDYSVSPENERLFCLVLQKAAEISPIYYRRGVFEIGDFRTDTLWGRVLEEQAKTVNMLGVGDYDESYGDGIYSITLK